MKIWEVRTNARNGRRREMVEGKRYGGEVWEGGVGWGRSVGGGSRGWGRGEVLTRQLLSSIDLCLLGEGPRCRQAGVA